MKVKIKTIARPRMIKAKNKSNQYNWREITKIKAKTDEILNELDFSKISI